MYILFSNPDGWGCGVWCYTSDEGDVWEPCDVPHCDGTGRSTGEFGIAYVQ